jgi:hypothetical protein
MRSRWIDDDRVTKGDRVAHTVIAKWRPWVHYLVTTSRIDKTSPVQRMISSVKTESASDDSSMTGHFVTCVVWCSRYGVARSDAEPLLEREYRTIDEAKAGHDEAVNAFAGK